LCKQDEFNDRNIARYYKKSETGWFVSDMLLTLGMIGTVAGFIYMLSSSFSDLNPQNATGMQGALIKMSKGMSTALYTTAAGLVCSMLLKLQVFNFTHRLDYLAAILGKK
jgi:flagellar motor component MotA